MLRRGPFQLPDGDRYVAVAADRLVQRVGA
jgi:hypothetical protein